MSRPRASIKQKEYLRRVCDRFGVRLDEDRLTFMDIIDASTAISIMKQAEQVAEWLADADRLEMFKTSD